MKLPKELNTVTPLSRRLALILFVFLPILGFLFGEKYQASIDNTISSQTYKTFTYPQISSPIQDVTHWQIYTDPKGLYTFKYPSIYTVTKENYPYAEEILVEANSQLPHQTNKTVLVITCPRGGGIYETQLPPIEENTTPNEGRNYVPYVKLTKNNNMQTLQFIISYTKDMQMSQPDTLTTDILRVNNPLVCEIDGPTITDAKGNTFEEKIKSLDFYNKFLQSFRFN